MFGIANVAHIARGSGIDARKDGPGMMWRGSGGWGPGTQYNRMYDPKTVETISGEVTSVDRITPAKGMSGGVHMNVKTDNETISVHLGSDLVPRKSRREDRRER